MLAGTPNPDHAAPCVDVREGPTPEGRAGLLAAFDQLLPQAYLVLSGTGDPRPFLDELQTRRKGLFEWLPLERSSDRFVVRLERRPLDAPTVRRITEALEWEHRRLHALARKAFWRSGDGDDGDQSSAIAFERYRHGLLRHMRLEEELLFPVFEVRSGLPHDGPTAVLREEHREVRELLAQLGEGQAGDDRLRDMEEALGEILRDHHRREEQIIFPGTDRLLSPLEGDALVARVQSFGGVMPAGKR